MKNTGNELPEETLETMVRSFFRESSSYGFSQIDYVRFVNKLLDLSLQTNPDSSVSPSSLENKPQALAEDAPKFLDLPISSKKIKIRKFSLPEDIELMKKWLADQYGQRFFLSRTTAQLIELDKIIRDEWNIFGIITTTEDVPIGCVAYLGFNAQQKKAELRKLIGEPSMRGKGLAKEASQLWINFGINGLQLKKIYLSTLNTDIRNIKLNEALGFKVEGILRNEICVDGQYHDVLRMALWKE